jgi:hypothetical protein
MDGVVIMSLLAKVAAQCRYQSPLPCSGDIFQGSPHGTPQLSARTAVGAAYALAIRQIGVAYCTCANWSRRRQSRRNEPDTARVLTGSVVWFGMSAAYMYQAEPPQTGCSIVPRVWAPEGLELDWDSPPNDLALDTYASVS